MIDHLIETIQFLQNPEPSQILRQLINKKQDLSDKNTFSEF